MRRFGSDYSLDAVYKAKSEVLKYLRISLWRIKNEIEKETEKTNPDALSAFVPSVVDSFESIVPPVKVFEIIARIQGRPSSGRADSCLKVVDQIKKLHRPGLSLVNVLEVRSAGTKRFEEACKRIDRVVEKIDRVIKMTER